MEDKKEIKNSNSSNVSEALLLEDWLQRTIDGRGLLMKIQFPLANHFEIPPEKIPVELVADIINAVRSKEVSILLASLLFKLDETIKQSEESAKIFEQHCMVHSEITSGAMAQAYKNVKQWIING